MLKMQESEIKLDVVVIWRGNRYSLGMDPAASLKELGDELHRLSDVKPDTMRLIIPQLSGKASRMFYPFSEEHSTLTLQGASINEGRPIRMMGVLGVEVDSFIKDAKADSRIAGFDEEERKLRLRVSDGPRASLKLPQGPYIFCDFRTLQLPGIELHPPASDALKRMHMLAADPGIVAIMNKHRWRVGIMTEMAPVGYVGVSPKCILGFNKNHGEEISLRLRTDDLKGFRKYESIKKTLLHELAHMVHSEHDENFRALDRQLNKEAFSLDWTKSRAYKLNEARQQVHLDEDIFVGSNASPVQKLGGDRLNQLENVRASSVAAAHRRLASGSTNTVGASEENEEPHSDDSGRNMSLESSHAFSLATSQEPDPDDPEVLPLSANAARPQMMETSQSQIQAQVDEPDPDDEEAKHHNKVSVETENFVGCHVATKITEELASLSSANEKPKFAESRENGTKAEPDPDDGLISQLGISDMQIDEPDPDDCELQRIQDSLDTVFKRLQQAIEKLRAEVKPSEAAAVLQMLFKIIRNIIEHPKEMKFKKLRKANPLIQRHIASYKAAMEILLLIGFTEDLIMDEIGKAEEYLVLKRNDPGLLWLAKSSLETCIAF